MSVGTLYLCLMGGILERRYNEYPFTSLLAIALTKIWLSGEAESQYLRMGHLVSSVP